MKHLFYDLSLRKVRFTWLLVILLVGLGISLSATRPAYAASFVVDNTSDTVDNIPGDGTCADSIGNCTLRAAIMEANALFGPDTITFASGLNGTPITISIAPDGTPNDGADGDFDITEDLTITGNGASATLISGGGIARVFQINSALTVQIDDLTITGGTTTAEGSPSWGGGILNSGNLTLNDVYVHGNSAPARGGGLNFASGTSVINNSTIYNNTSGTSGGGIFTGRDSSTVIVTLKNSTISGNSAGGSGGGLAVYQFAGGSTTTTVAHVTVANNVANNNNDASSGGGISNIPGVSGTLNLENSIVSNNSVSFGGSGTDCSGTITSQGYNMTGTSCGISGTGDTVDDPLLASLADNGGPTLTHALATNSPAIDLIPNTVNGCGTTYTTDQRGLTRPNDGDGNSTGECEIGAYEAGEKHCSVTSGNNYTFTSQSGVLIHVNSTGTDLGCLYVDEKPTNHPNATGLSAGMQTGKYWTIEGLQLDGITPAAADFSVNLTLPHSVSPDTNAYVCKYPGGLGGAGWDCARTTSTAGTVTRDNISSLSDWAVGNNVGPTALTLQTLTARSATMPVAMTAFALVGIGYLLFIWRKKNVLPRP